MAYSVLTYVIPGADGRGYFCSTNIHGMTDIHQTLTNEGPAIAALTARLILGILFFFQGYDAVFKIGIGRVAETYLDSYAARKVPRFVTILGAWFTSLAELTGGLLLILGLCKYAALSLLGIDLVVASLAFSIAQPMWDTRHVLPRLLLLLLLLLLPASADIYSLDNYLFKP